MRAASMTGERDRAWLLAHPDAIEVPAEAIDDGRARVAVDPAGRRLGFSVVLAIAGRACELDGLFVDPRFMRRGVGSALVRDVAARARAQGAERIDVIANDNALAFYEHMGFRGSEWVPTRHRPGLRMSLALTGPVA